MPIEKTVYDTSTLLGVIRDNKAMQPPSRYWLDLAFPGNVNFTEEYIEFSRLSSTRKLAPLVVPTAQGRPIYSAAERLTRIKPAYVKPKDAVSSSRMVQRAAGLGELGGKDQREMSPQQRYNSWIGDILREHRRAIERRWEWLAAEAVINGKVTLEGEAYPETVVDFERDATHTQVLTAGAFWGDAGVSILESIAGFRKIVSDSRFGGGTNRLTVGSEVWAVMRNDKEIRELLNSNYRLNSGAELKMGLLDDLDIEVVGKLSGSLTVVVYNDHYENPDGSWVPFMSPKDIVLTGPNIQGVRAFGAIQDKGAGFQAKAIFPKMWEQEDPSATFVMSQSAPLMVPLGPNSSLKATVVA